MFPQAPWQMASDLIQSTSYPRSASNMVRGRNPIRSTQPSRLSCTSPAQFRAQRGSHDPLSISEESLVGATAWRPDRRIKSQD